jgi:metal-responsive CopG/Arc/MetJ family transcriptional regulator
MANQKLRQRITISLDKEALETLSSIASQNDVSIARVIRYAVDNLLKEWKEGRQHQLQLILPLGGKKEVAVT